ncbi:DUF6011 domain-containing protein [Siminovitchia terrae]|uniref:DUF6011 domain-containing protein n=1 Tax=Siminovitchia terrae TaxID=1914933 RepID=UPI003570A17B
MQCSRCGRSLKDTKSRDRGYGPVCYKRFRSKGGAYRAEDVGSGVPEDPEGQAE